MTLIVLLRITFANYRKPLSHKAWLAETQPFDRSEDGQSSAAPLRFSVMVLIAKHVAPRP